MSGFLTEDWIAEATAALAGVDAGDAEAMVQYTVSGAPDGKVILHAVIGGGAISLASGKATDPDISISLGYDDARSLVAGERTADAIFMSGALKLEGDHPRWLLDLRSVRAAALAALTPLLD